MKTKEVEQRLADIMGCFEYEHLPEDLQLISKPFCAMAAIMVIDKKDIPTELQNTSFGPLPDNIWREQALLKLLEAKDAAVRSYVIKKKMDDDIKRQVDEMFEKK